MAYDIDRSITQEQFVTTVAHAARIGLDRAERATEATLQTLAERIDAGEARDLAEELPDEVAPWLATTTPAERHAPAVFIALQRTVSPQEFADLSAELPKDFDPLLPAGPDIEVISTDSFIRGVANRAATDADEARRAIEAVLETLAMRIAGGEVDDLRARLPVQFHPALDRGRGLSGGKATRMTLDDFVRRVAEREGISLDRALEHVSAVLRAVREAVDEQEFLDVTSQLPAEYEELVRR
jgi:uncharacterized protein (DUF2267 family)